MPEIVKKELLKAKEKINEHKNLFGPTYNNSGYICVYEDGLPLRPDYVTRVFIKTVRKLGCYRSH
ncbi:hypothetical protein [Carboxydothermus ferrireducens]|uniref:Uncharacterized protein n=1 Tax=Carboxydothermus ferrireducens DSM 11255 TaxID=1119529 RepID=A0ABX2RDU1_9THEO|nr:hypothetical protein [Carboxydothermus ferrireducens]NYE58062.1 hypothetical protein [Carboxydothermus ferrireducens DSM 11255]